MSTPGGSNIYLNFCPAVYGIAILMDGEIPKSSGLAHPVTRFRRENIEFCK